LKKIQNDQNCFWIKYLEPRHNIKVINKNLESDWLVVGAGFTGLSAARKLSKLNPSQKIILVDAQLAGEGASSRNSGYLVDTTLNDGFSSNREIETYKKKVAVYKLGINAVRKFVTDYQVDCEWSNSGKFFASSNVDDKKLLLNFSETLSRLNYEHYLFSNHDLKKKLGTNFYNVGLYTKGGILLNPGKLVRAMIKALPNNVNLFENSPLVDWTTKRNYIDCKFENANVKTKKIIFATNGFLSSLGIKKNYSFPLTLTASVTRPLTNHEYKLIGEPQEWGVLPVRPMGATVRMTKDRRILIRNTAEMKNPFKMDQKDLSNRSKKQLMGIKKRFPDLPENIIEHSWSGIVCRSRNGSQIFENLDKNIFVAGCYNGSGIGVGTLFGEQIAIKASGLSSREIEIIQDKIKLLKLPPNPFLSLGVKARLMYERIRARSEI